MANSVDPDQTAPISEDDIFRRIFFLGALSVNYGLGSDCFIWIFLIKVFFCQQSHIIKPIKC